MAQRTPAIQVDEDFTYGGHVTKAWEDKATGQRYIRGVASGILEDRDGERVSARAIAKMAATPTGQGAIKLTSSHVQDWSTEFGDVAKLTHDREHDELLVDCQIPAEGVDPIADKAWRAMTVEGRKMGFSVGGKLHKAFYELADGVGKSGRPRRRKVLDEIALRHVMLTERPSYRQSFAEVVAKSFTGDAPAEDDQTAWTFEAPDVEAADALAIAKAVATDDDEPKPKPDADAPEQPAAATADTAQDAQDADTDGDSDAAAATQLPEAKRHLSCPSCGHEFAADLPATDAGDPTTPNDHQDDADARKSHQETDMETPQDTLAKIRALVDAEPVAKTAIEPEATAPAATEPVVAKSDDELSDVEKMVAASHRHGEEQLAELTTQVREGFELIGKAFKGLTERVAAEPTGRQSVARVLPPATDVEKSDTETEESVEDLVAKTDDPLAALKVINSRKGIR